MRHKEHTLRKLEAQSNKLESIQKSIEGNNISARDVVRMISEIRKEIDLVVERIELEPNV
jgi:hypothetical protein